MSLFPLLASAVPFLLLAVASWRSQKWVSFVALSLLMGGTLVYIFSDVYFEFSFYLTQILLVLFGSAFLLKGRSQKLLVGIIVAALVTAGLAKDSLLFTHLAVTEYSIFLYMAYALLPLLYYSPVQGRDEDLEKMVCFQQTWLRTAFLYWSIGQGINISHYDLYRQYIFNFGVSAALVLLIALLLRRRLFWTLAQQSILTLLILGVCLDRINMDSRVVFVWIMLLALSVLLPKSPGKFSTNATKFLKRIEFGAFGGGVFWSLILVVHMGAVSSIVGSMLWTFIIFLIGLFSWMRDLPSPLEQEEKYMGVFVFGTRAAVQILLLGVFLYPIG